MMTDRDPSNRYAGETPTNLPENRRDAEYYSDAFVEFLRPLDVDYVFLLPGSSFRGLHDSLRQFRRNHKPKLIMGIHEQAVISMALRLRQGDQKARVCMVAQSVGLYERLYGDYNAFADRVPLLVLAAAVRLIPQSGAGSTGCIAPILQAIL